MNRELGPKAALVPKAVPKTLRAFKKGSIGPIETYLRENLPDAEQVDRILTIISIGIGVISIVGVLA